MKDRLNGYWTKKDGSEYVFIEKVFKAGHVTGIRYFKRDGCEIIDMNVFKVTHEELLENYNRGYEKRD